MRDTFEIGGAGGGTRRKDGGNYYTGVGVHSYLELVQPINI